MRPKKVLKKNRTPAAANGQVLKPVERRIGITMNDAVMLIAVVMKAFLRPRPSIRRTEKMDEMA